MVLGSRLRLILAHLSAVDVLPPTLGLGIRWVPKTKIFHGTVAMTAARTSSYCSGSVFSPVVTARSLSTGWSGPAMHIDDHRPQIVIHPLILNPNEAEEVTNLYFIDRPWPRVTEESNQGPTISRLLSLPTDFPRRSTLHPQHCNGLLLLYSNTDCDLYATGDWDQMWYSSLEIIVVNPTTGDMDRLPTTRRIYAELLKAPAIGYVSRTNEYKVVSITDASCCDDSELGVEVFTLGQGAKNWRLLRPMLDPDKVNRGIQFCGCSLLFDEAVHWLLSFKKDQSFGILQFRLETETFSLIPISLPKEESWLHLVEIQGQIGVLTYASKTEKLEIWMLNNRGKGISCVCSMNIDKKDIRPRGCGKTSWRVLSIGNGEIMLSSHECLFLLNICDGSFQVVSRYKDGFNMCLDGNNNIYDGSIVDDYVGHEDVARIDFQEENGDINKHKKDDELNEDEWILDDNITSEDEDLVSLWPKRFYPRYYPMEFAIFQKSQVSWPHPPLEDPANRPKRDDDLAMYRDVEPSFT